MAASGDRWLQDYDKCERISKEILEKINKRDGQGRVEEGSAQINAAIRLQLKQFGSNLIMLRQNLIQSSSSSYITEQEIQRRQTMLDNLDKKQNQLQSAFSKRITNLNNDRSALFNRDFSHPSTTRQVDEEPDETRYLNVGEMRNRQAALLEEQDKGLEALSQVITRHKQMGYVIADEIDVQNDLIDDITDHVDRTRERLIRETDHVQIVHRKSGACWLWVIIILLLIAIIIVSVIPSK